MTKTRILPAIGLASITLLALAGCAGTPTGGSGGGAAAADGEIVGGPGVDVANKTITVGAMVPVSGVFAGAVTNIEGMEAGFWTATQPGGALEGWTVKVSNQDTEYDAATAIPLYESFKDDVAIIGAILGSHIIGALLPSVEADGIVLVPGGTTPDLVEVPAVIPTFPMTSSHPAALVPYAVEAHDKEDATFCALTDESPLGTYSAETFEFATSEMGLDVGTMQKYPVNSDQLGPQITALKNAGCEVLFAGGTGAFLQYLAVQSVQQSFEPLVLAANSAYTITVATGPGADWLIRNAVISVPGDAWEGANSEGQRLMVEALAATYPDTTPGANAHMTGFANAMYVSEVLAAAIEAGDLSREGITAAVNGIGTWEDELGMVGGDVVYGSGPEDRVPPHRLSMFRIAPDVPTGLELEKYYYDSPVTAAYVESVTG